MLDRIVKSVLNGTLMIALRRLWLVCNVSYFRVYKKVNVVAHTHMHYIHKKKTEPNQIQHPKRPNQQNTEFNTFLMESIRRCARESINWNSNSFHSGQTLVHKLSAPLFLFFLSVCRLAHNTYSVKFHNFNNVDLKRRNLSLDS